MMPVKESNLYRVSQSHVYLTVIRTGNKKRTENQQHVATMYVNTQLYVTVDLFLGSR